MLGSPAGPGGPPQRGLWPLAPAPAPSATSFSTDGLGKYNLFSLFPGGPTIGSALYSHASSIGRFASGHIQQSSSGNTFHAAHKVSDSLFTTAGYTFGPPTPPPGSPYSSIPVAQFELLTKGCYSNNIIVQQAQEFPASPKKIQIVERQQCDEKYCSTVQKCQKSCHCSPTPVKKGADTIFDVGCSRTNPIEWPGINVKKEPGTPCQVAEITTSGSPLVKLEVTSPTQKTGGGEALNMGGSVFNGNGAQIPVGIAVARQRVQHEMMASPSLPPAGLLAAVGAGGGAQIKEIDNAAAVASMAAGTAAGAALGGGTVLQSADERGPALATWPMGGGHGPTLTTPTVWQYPQYPAPVPVEPVVPLPIPTVSSVGLHLVRDPTGGIFILNASTGIEPVQPTVVWPSYPQSSSVLLPSLPPMQPPPLQLLSSASSGDYLSSSTTLHQHTQTHSTRLVAVTTDAKRKIPLPTLIKIETDGGGVGGGGGGTLDQGKALQTVNALTTNNSGTTMYAADQTVPPLVTTHVIYQHPTNLIVSHTPIPSTEVTTCRSQATSPVTTCMVPSESLQIHEEEPPTNVSTVQDASNQTDNIICSEDDSTNHAVCEMMMEGKIKEVSEVEETAYEPMEEELAPEPMSVEAEQSKEISSTDKLIEREERQQDDQPPPDLSGLELLSNSIVEFESGRITQTAPTQPMDTSSTDASSTASSEESMDTTTAQPEDGNIPSLALNVGESLGGLKLLCALAEQRIKEIKEETVETPPKAKDERHKSSSKERQRDKERRRREKRKSDKHRKREKRYYLDKADSDKEKTDNECVSNQYKHYKTDKSRRDVRKYLESKAPPNFYKKKEWPDMDPNEAQMRMRIAEVQKEHKEKLDLLIKMESKKHTHHSDYSKKKSRKKSTHRERSRTPELEQASKDTTPHYSSDLVKPSKLSVLPKVESHKRRHSETNSSPDKHSSSSKKRKVGRPKRHMSTGELLTTETIVAKKLKNNFIGCFLAAKEKLKQQNSKERRDSTPPRYIEETTTPTTTTPYTHKLKRIKNNNNNNNNNNTISMDQVVKSSKIRPKLRAEATVKVEDDDDWPASDDHIEDDDDDRRSFDKSNGTLSGGDEESLPETNKTESKEETTTMEDEKQKPTPEERPNPCALTESHLEIDKLRVLTAMGGLFYAGQLNALEPPDVYSITLDGERGNKPHIMSREEILRDAIVEISPKSTAELSAGTRLCAYWSQQYRCLYPGSAAEPGTPNPQLDGKFVSVEFDDGDSGRIALQDIRLLPPNYPIMEYDPNPLLSLSKRRRRTSTSVSTEEKHHLPEPPMTTKPLQQLPLEEPSTSAVGVQQHHKDKKRIKKKKKEKVLKSDDKKRRKKHKCVDEFCKHKKHHHKKHHKKHRKHHDKTERSENSSDDQPRGNFTCEIINAEESKSDEDLEEEEDAEAVWAKKENVDPTTEKLPAEQEDDDDDDEQEQNSVERFDDEDEPLANPDDEVTMEDIGKAVGSNKSKKIRDRQESCESKSKISAFLTAKHLWRWHGNGYKRPKAKGKSKKTFFKSIERGKEILKLGDAAVFLSMGSIDRPYIGRIQSMWEMNASRIVKVKWFYHPEETEGCPKNIKYPGALFESSHEDENDVQTILHKCEVIPLKDYLERLGNDPSRLKSVYEENDVYYLAGSYDPRKKKLDIGSDIVFADEN